MNTIDTDTIDGLTVRYVEDEDADAPWDNCDGHGPVRRSHYSHTETRSDKRPGERPLNSTGRFEYQYYYDWQDATKQARRDGWNAAPYDAPDRVQRAVQADFDYLRAYIAGDWCYVGIVIEDDEGNKLDSLWGVETYKNGHLETAREMVAQCIETKRAAWRRALREARERRYWASRDVETAGV